MKDKIKKSLDFSFINGIFSNAMAGFTQDYLTPFILLLGGTARQVGMLNAFPNLLSALVQLKSPDITEWFKNRKKTVLIFVFIEAVILVLIAAAAVLGRMQPYLFILLMAFYSGSAGIVNPAWGSWISNLVEPKNRAEFFGRRNRIYGFVSIGSTFLAGLILFNMKRINPFYGFAILFGFAFICRLIGFYYLTKIYEPPLFYDRSQRFSMAQFLGHIRKSNYARFVVFIAFLSFAVNLASPFFAVLMLKDLKFSYLLYTMLVISAALTRHLSISRWGSHADRVGNLKIIKFVSLFIGIIPLLWIINRNPAFLVFAQVFAGFLWSGFYLCTSNFIYDAAAPEKRTRCIAYFNVLHGFAIFLGALTGGLILNKLPPLFGHKILTLLLISAVLRIVVVMIFEPMVREVRPVHKINNKQLFYSMINYKTILGIDRKSAKYMN